MKTKQDENFPVASLLIATSLRKHINTFYLFARYADDIADSSNINPEEKLNNLKEVDKALLEKVDINDHNKYAVEHFISSMETGVSTEHARHLVQAFTMDVRKSRYRNWSELLNYCRFSAAPVGRYLIDLHNCDESAKKSTDALCIALQILNHLQDCKKDYLELNRVYIPKTIFKDKGAPIEDLSKERTSNRLRNVFNSLLDKVDELILIANKAPNLISVRGLRLETAIIIVIAKTLSNKLRYRDPLEEYIKLNKFQYIQCVIKGLLFKMYKN